MTENQRKEHWESVYQKKALTEVSWYQTRPTVSWELMQYLGIARDAAIIDIGGGDSLLVDFLLSEGFTHVTVLDISERAINRAKERLGPQANRVKWIVSDITEFSPAEKYDLWHDRAVLHFLTEDRQVERYVETAKQALKPGGKLIVGTFSETGPEKCSGLTVRRYSESAMTQQFEKYFEKLKCEPEAHRTPFETVQNFIFCAFMLRRP